ncbi:MAG: serine/threonine protein kinase [Planctomycetes bacterium]|nr:serine/threonine protein kinase [Planctomycetota bacterium]
MSESKAELESEERSVTPSGSPLPEDAGDDEHRPSESASTLPPSSEEETARTPITDLIGRRLGEFRLLRRIGHGGMAEVYLAEQTSLKRNVAVKVLREEMLSDETHLKRFEQEAKAAAGLNHPNIVQVFMIGEQDGIQYIAQEYVAGMNLREYLNRKGPPKLATALKFMRQIAAALDAAADAGIVHRDVKPENILINRKGDVKVTDFGLALLSLPGERVHLTQVGMTMGTPLYMSPEQVNGRNVDHRSDIYSFGVTCYHLLGGNPPFHGESAISVAVQHVNDEPPPLEQQRPDLPKVVCRLVHRMLAKNPDDRYQSARTIVTDIRKIAAALRDHPADVDRVRLSVSETAAFKLNWYDRVARWSLRKRISLFLFMFLTVTGGSAAIGYLTLPGDPFATTPAIKKPTVPRKQTALDQYFYANIENYESAWKAVQKYFPDEKYQSFHRSAKLGLALFYLRKRRFDEAEFIFKEFADGKDQSIKANGFAGLAISANLRADYKKSDQIILNNFQDINAVRPVDLSLENMLKDADSQNQEKLGRKKRQDLFPPAAKEDPPP